MKNYQWTLNPLINSSPGILAHHTNGLLFTLLYKGAVKLRILRNGTSGASRNYLVSDLIANRSNCRYSLYV